jgi:hypothetical protein
MGEKSARASNTLVVLTRYTLVVLTRNQNMGEKSARALQFTADETAQPAKEQNEPAPRELFDTYEICSAAALDQKQCLMMCNSPQSTQQL